jgi:UDP-2,4-diacetamido-2,4,6-trideoxy-beta-L-altropyranose hydrolase
LDTPKQELIIGADCGSRIGTGHVMRCLALAQVWKRAGGKVTFRIPEGSPAIEKRIRLEGCCLKSLASGSFPQAVVDCMRQAMPGLVVLDGYDFGLREQSALSAAGHRVMVIDDFGQAAEYPVRWILNQNPQARPDIYARRGIQTKLLLGSKYALLRQEFGPWLGWRRTVPEHAGKILVTIGGSDPDNLSLQILESLSQLKDANLEVVLVAGGSNPYLRELQCTIESSPTRVRMVTNTLDMPSLMAWADVAISGAGGTAYELCYMGLPALLFVIAENQRGIAESLSNLSAAVNAGWARDFDAGSFAERLRQLIGSRSARQALSTRARELVDGLGADRVRAALVDRELHLRTLCEDDGQLLFSWANDPQVREASFHSELISRNDHERWFLEKLQDPNTVIYIAENGANKPIGQVRFQLEADRAILSVSVAPEFRGAGWGKELITLAVRVMARSRLVRRIDAFVKPGNRASIRLFESCGFHQEEGSEVAGQPALVFVWTSGVWTSGAWASGSPSHA